MSTLNIGSGIANCVMNYYRKIVCKGIQFDFLLFDHMENEFVEEAEGLGGNVYFISQPTINFGKYTRSVKRFFKEHRDRWDIVHIHEILVQRFIAKTCKKHGGVKKVAIHSHASKFIVPMNGVSALKNKAVMAFKRIRNSFLLSGIRRNCDCYFACSENAGIALYGKRIIQDKNFHIIRNAIDPERYVLDEETRERYRNEFGISNKKVVIQVGRLCEEKNQLFILDAMKEVVKIDSAYVLLLVGEGHLRKEIEDAISRLDLGENVILTGNRTDIDKILSCADLFVLPSLCEGLGIVLIEAQASGLPCIASTGVPKEAAITPYVKFVDLSEGSERWAEEVLSCELTRHSVKNYIADSGYDINESVDKLVGCYSAMSEAA